MLSGDGCWIQALIVSVTVEETLNDREAWNNNSDLLGDESSAVAHWYNLAGVQIAKFSSESSPHAPKVR